MHVSRTESFQKHLHNLLRFSSLYFILYYIILFFHVLIYAVYGQYYDAGKNQPESSDEFARILTPPTPNTKKWFSYAVWLSMYVSFARA
jgi:hypothetical protein